VQRWGGLGPFLLKVEPEEFVEEDVPAPVPIPTPVSVVHIGLMHPFLQTFPFQGSCIVQIQLEEENSSYHSCEEILLALSFFLSSPFSFISSKILL
jgi:hypothetical protein